MREQPPTPPDLRSALRRAWPWLVAPLLAAILLALLLHALSPAPDGGYAAF